MVVCLERDTDLHMAQLMPLPLTVSCFNKIQTVFTFLVPAHAVSPGQRAVKRVCVCVCVCVCFVFEDCLTTQAVFVATGIGEVWCKRSNSPSVKSPVKEG